jgi:hypothetical protein
MHKFRIVFYSLTVLVCIILIIYGLDVYPIPGTDSIVFIPPAILYSRGYGLANSIYQVARITDPTHTDRFNYYVPLYSWLMGMLSSIKPGLKTIFFFCSLFSVSGLLLYARTISSQLPSEASRFLKALVLLSVVYIATYLLPTAGRPETITTFLAFLVYLVYTNKTKYHAAVYNTAICILFALILSSQILCFYFGFLLLLSFDLLNSTNVYKTILINIARAVAIILLFCLILAVSPNGLANTLTGINKHIAFALHRASGDAKLFIYFWMFAPINFGFAIVFVLSAIYYIRDIFIRLKEAALIKCILVITLQLFITFGIIKYILYAAPTIYNATQFILPMSAFLLLNIFSSVKSNFKTVASGLVVIAYAGGALIFVRTGMFFIDNKQSGKDFASAKIIVEKIRDDNKNAFVTNSLWCLIDNPNDVRLYRGNPLKPNDVIILQQANYDIPRYITDKGYTVIYDWGTNRNRKFLGIPIGERPHGYSFIVCKMK